MKKIEKRVVRCVATVIAAEMLCLAAKPLSMSAAGGAEQGEFVRIEDNAADEIAYTYENEGISPACIIKRETGTFYYYAQPFSGKVKIADMMNLDTDSIRVISVSNYDMAPIEDRYYGSGYGGAADYNVCAGRERTGIE
ncbi:MAG: hypothetical protein HDQ99_07865 [Lachnospiraceae bacterium]|nr:hypothetical protein [Lachnospiraceae bacterium]